MARKLKIRKLFDREYLIMQAYYNKNRKLKKMKSLHEQYCKDIDEELVDHIIEEYFNKVVVLYNRLRAFISLEVRKIINKIKQ